MKAAVHIQTRWPHEAIHPSIATYQAIPWTLSSLSSWFEGTCGLVSHLFSQLPPKPLAIALSAKLLATNWNKKARSLAMRFAMANKAYMAVTLGAAIELKEQVAKRGLPVVTARPPTSAAAREVAGAGEESLRMVMYLSCWGPS
ncbi:hypothetical protein GUJ93_ZPchr0013g36397 [Zizania palustris]|uniref:Uncharacterized protein n=1 Tax=Zizania palustris TaxID=103762 RepID=A0A8J5X170_ZIZPA|nr:hypothetical protein GUJ93_ZPchr0013g36397 [Zizania palustris]